MRGLPSLYELIHMLVGTDINNLQLSDIRPLTNNIQEDLIILNIIINNHIDMHYLDYLIWEKSPDEICCQKYLSEYDDGSVNENELLRLIKYLRKNIVE